MKKLILSVAAVVAVVSCNQKEMQAPSLVREVSIVANSADTKTQLSENAVLWEANDAISLRFAKDAAYHIATFSTTGSGGSAIFSGELPSDVSVAGGYTENVYAVYPASAMANDGTVSFSLDANRDVTYGSFPSGHNLSSALISLADLDADGSASATFKNAFAVLRFTLDAGVTRVKITANGALAGSAEMQFGEDGRLAVRKFNSTDNTLTLTPAEDAETFDASKVYNILVFPGSHTSLSVEMTDVHGCVFAKEITGTYNFVASNFHTLNFNTVYVKEYTFTATGKTITAGEQVAVVYKDATSVVQEAVVAADTDLKFVVNQIQAVAHGTNVAGYAIAPASAYNVETDKISYTMGDKLYAAKLGESQVAFNGVDAALSAVEFTAPVGVKVTKIVSDKGLAGKVEMTVNADGTLAVAGEGSQKEFTLNVASGVKHTMTVFPVSGANVTVTLADAAGKTIDKTVSLTVAAGKTATLDLSGNYSFDKNGNFTNENFTSGGSYEF